MRNLCRPLFGVVRRLQRWTVMIMVAILYASQNLRLGQAFAASASGPTMCNVAYCLSRCHDLNHRLNWFKALKGHNILLMRTVTTHSDSLEDSSSYQKTYRLQGATTPKNKSSVTVTSNTGHTLTTDLPTAMGGKDSAPQPVETLLAALIGCTQATALFVGRHIQPTRLVLDRLEFDISAVRDERGAIALPLVSDDNNEHGSGQKIPSRLHRVSGTVTVYAVKNQKIGPEAMEMLKELTEQRCPVANMMIASGCRMDVVWVDGNA